jgi:hypothetical protein
MNVSLLRDNKLLHGDERRGSRMSVRMPSRQPSMASLKPHSPNASIGKCGRFLSIASFDFRWLYMNFAQWSHLVSLGIMIWTEFKFSSLLFYFWTHQFTGRPHLTSIVSLSICDIVLFLCCKLSVNLLNYLDELLLSLILFRPIDFHFVFKCSILCSVACP